MYLFVEVADSLLSLTIFTKKHFVIGAWLDLKYASESSQKLYEDHTKIDLAFIDRKIDRKPKAYAEPCQTCKVKCFAKNIFSKRHSKNPLS